ncbi:MAG: GDP-mannose 4,6-dehydratase [Candidatus Omnitrophica bacterium]|nr:GDP-mannose 4,6-dehydratase [Candidatus Omnitrophota bacterium]
MNKEKILITGSGGFTAGHFMDYLGISGISDDRIFSADREPNLCGLQRRHFIKVDLLDKAQTSHMLKKIRPDLIFHFAGLNSSRDYDGLLRANLFTTNNLLDAVIQNGMNPRILVIGSAAEYGLAGNSKKPIRETVPLAPITPYGVSKAAQTMLALQYCSAFGLYIVIARSFNLIGPGQTSALVCGSIVRQVKVICTGMAKANKKLIIGNTHTKRDFVDVRDAVRAYWQLLACKRNISGQVFNVGSGQANSIRDVVKILLKYCGRDIPLEQQPGKIRQIDIPVQIADVSKIKAAIGWESMIPIERSLKDMYESLGR